MLHQIKKLKRGYNVRKLHEHFKTLLGDIPDTKNLNNEEIQGSNIVELDTMLTEQEIRKAVFKQKNGKSSGQDDISAEIIKSSYDIILPFLVSIFYISFQ